MGIYFTGDRNYYFTGNRNHYFMYYSQFRNVYTWRDELAEYMVYDLGREV